MHQLTIFILTVGATLSTNAFCQDGPMAVIAISKDKKGFVYAGTDTKFKPWGVNYDHDSQGRLIEDYWDNEWPMIEKHFEQIRDLPANIVRIHLQFAKFMKSPTEPNEHSLGQLKRLIRLAEKQKLYLDLTGLGCYHKKDVPKWYDALDEKDRWAAQANFWIAIATIAKDSPAIFCYDLMNEPVVPGGLRKDRDWLGGAFGDKHFVQFITLDQKNRPRYEIAKDWIDTLCKAIRKVDSSHLITVGLVDWSLDRPGLTSGFIPEKVTAGLDFIAMHLYPEAKKIDEAIATLKGFNIGKPVIIEEIFPLKCSLKEMNQFIDESRSYSAGLISFYWGQPIEELKNDKSISAAITTQWLSEFRKQGQFIHGPK